MYPAEDNSFNLTLILLFFKKKKKNNDLVTTHAGCCFYKYARLGCGGVRLMMIIPISSKRVCTMFLDMFTLYRLRYTECVSNMQLSVLYV